MTWAAIFSCPSRRLLRCQASAALLSCESPLCAMCMDIISTTPKIFEHKRCHHRHVGSLTQEHFRPNRSNRGYYCLSCPPLDLVHLREHNSKLCVDAVKIQNSSSVVKYQRLFLAPWKHRRAFWTPSACSRLRRPSFGLPTPIASL